MTALMCAVSGRQWVIVEATTLAVARRRQENKEQRQQEAFATAYLLEMTRGKPAPSWGKLRTPLPPRLSWSICGIPAAGHRHTQTENKAGE